MEFDADFSDVQEGGTFVTVPEGKYDVQITEIKEGWSKAGDPMIGVGLMVVGGDFAGAMVWDNILIPDPGSAAEKIRGRSMHFLHCIGEPYEGKFKVQTDNWAYKRCSIIVKHEAPNTFHTYVKACVAGYSAIENDQNNDPTPEKAQDGDEVPF